MKVTIPVTFELEWDGDEEPNKQQAKDAAEMAVFDHACFTESMGYSSNDSCSVHVDGFGPITVELAD